MVAAHGEGTVQTSPQHNRILWAHSLYCIKLTPDTGHVTTVALQKQKEEAEMEKAQKLRTSRTKDFLGESHIWTQCHLRVAWSEVSTGRVYG